SVMSGYSLIGFLDDFIKFAMKRNLGLTSKQKMLGQLLIAYVFFAILRAYDFPTYIQFPGTHIQWDLNWGYAFLIIFMLVGAFNLVNLTNGLDGLLTGAAAIAFGALVILA